MEFKQQSNRLLTLVTLGVIWGVLQCSLLSTANGPPQRLLSSDFSSTSALERKLDELGKDYKSPSKRKQFLKAKRFLLKSIKKRKLDLSLVTKKGNRKGRKLMLSMLLDLIKGAKGFLNPLLMPTLIPQVSDPRITIQTFNPPNNAVLPPDLGPKKLNFEINMPDIYTSGPDFVKNELFVKENMAKSKST